MPTLTTTTTTFLPNRALCYIAMLTKDTIAFYNSWKIDEFSLIVTELMLITPNGYTVSYNVNVIKRKDHENIKVSINIGKYYPKSKPNIQFQKFYDFKYNNSFVYKGHPEIGKIENTENGEILDTLQCELDYNNDVALSTKHSKIDNVVFVNSIQIKTYDYYVEFSNDLLYLCDLRTNIIAIGQPLAKPQAILEFDANILKRKFGKQIRIIDGIENLGKFVRAVGFKSMHVQFKNCNIKSEQKNSSGSSTV